MANGSIFSPTIETQPVAIQAAAPVTAGGVGDIAQTLAPVVQEGASLGRAFVEEGKLEEEFGKIDDELQGLNKQFTNISDAIKTGANRRNLQMRARTALKSAIASSPRLAPKAEAMFTKHFGGGDAGTARGTSSFQLSPQEAQAEKVASEVAEWEVLGYSPEQAMGAVRAKREAELAKNQATILATKDKVGMSEVMPVVNAGVTDWSVDYNRTVQTMMVDNGGTLTQEMIVNLGRQTDAMGLRKKQELERMLRGKDGRYKVGQAQVDNLYAKIDAEVANQKAIARDNSYQKFITNQQLISTADATVTAIQMYPQVAVLKSLGGDEFAAKFLNANADRNDKVIAFMNERNPAFAEIMSGNFGMVNKISVAGAAKLFPRPDEGITRPVGAVGPNGVPELLRRLTTEEAAIVGDQVATDHTMAITTLTEGSPEAMSSLSEEYPAVLAATYSPQTQTTRQMGKGNILENVAQLQFGAVDLLNKQFQRQFGYFPSGLEVIVSPADIPSRGNWNPKPKISVNATGGERMSQEMVNLVADLYRSIVANPKAVPEKLRGLPPEQVLAVYVNSGMRPEHVPEPLIEEFVNPFKRKDKPNVVGDAELLKKSFEATPKEGTERITKRAREVSES